MTSWKCECLPQQSHLIKKYMSQISSIFIEMIAKQNQKFTSVKHDKIWMRHKFSRLFLPKSFIPSLINWLLNDFMRKCQKYFFRNFLLLTFLRALSSYSRAHVTRNLLAENLNPTCKFNFATSMHATFAYKGLLFNFMKFFF